MAGRLVGLTFDMRAAPGNPSRASLATIGLPGQAGYFDTVDGGAGSIIGEAPGLVTFDGVPGRALLLLCEYKTMRVVRGTRSAADGTYVLPHLRTDREYVLTAFDETRSDNAVIVDRVQAGP